MDLLPVSELTITNQEAGLKIMDIVDGVSTEFITGNEPKLVCQKCLGGGGFGKVYEVRSPHTHFKHFLLKFLVVERR